MEWLRRRLRPWLRGILVGLGVAAAVGLGLLEGVERWGLNHLFELRGPIPPATPITIISIDEESFDELDRQWPWPRAMHAQLLDILARGKPAAIGLDIVFPEPSALGPADDRALGAAIRRAGNVVLAAALTRSQTDFYTKEDLNPPIAPIRAGAAAVGFVNFPQESDAYVRSAHITRAYQGRLLEGFDLHLYRLGVQAGIPARPLPDRSRLLINYRGGPKTFPTVPYYQVLRGEVKPEAFAGRIVLVGATSPILHDVFPTPFATDGRMPGVEIHANALETLFQGSALARAPRALGLAAILAAALLAVWVTGRLRPLPALGILLAAGGAYLLLVFAAFAAGRLWLDLAGVPNALLIGFGLTTLQNFIREQREKRRLSRFFSPSVVTEIVRAQDDARLGSARRTMTVLFSDIRGFTSMSEKMSPEDVASFLREYLTEMTDAVFQEGGTVDKYIGDAIMALYNVPFEQPDHAVRAVRTALAFQERLKPLAARFQEKYGGDLRCGVGINTGEAVVGTIGSEQRLEYTAIGDTINLGSRLESITKDFKVNLVISESTQALLPAEFLSRYLGEVKVKGKEVAVKIYTVEPASGRREPRVAVPGMVTIREDEVALQVPLRDLSRGGLSVRDLPKEYPIGHRLALSLAFPGHPPVPLNARVAWIGGGATGFQILEPIPEALRAIEAALAAPPAPPEGADPPPTAG